jgi:hypothetical protein
VTSQDRLNAVRSKIGRANKHIDDLAIACKTFTASTPFVLDRETDPSTGYYHFKLTKIQPPPREIALITGDAIHNLRSALDHLAYQLVLANGSTPLRQTCFPIFDDIAKYQSMDANKVRGMSQGALDAIDAARPFKGGNEALYTLHDLDIADKHHALLTTLVAVGEASIEVNATLRNFKAPPFALPHFQTPLNDGDVFFVCEPGVENQTRIDFDVALCEPEIIKGRPIVRALRWLVKEVDDTIQDFGALL